MPYQLDRLVDRSDDALLAEIRRVAALVDHPVLSVQRFRVHARTAHFAYLHRFGSWQESLTRAGLGHRYGGPAVTPKLRRRAGGRLGDDELIALLRRVARPDGVVSIAEVDRLSPVSWITYRRRFGSWPEAVRRAGLKQSKRARVYDEHACLANLRALWNHYGRAPRFEEAAKPPSTVGPASPSAASAAGTARWPPSSNGPTRKRRSQRGRTPPNRVPPPQAPRRPRPPILVPTPLAGGG